MCFSAQASFLAGALLSAAGLLALYQVQQQQQSNQKYKSNNASSSSYYYYYSTALSAFAAIPLIFGLHQWTEGLVWLDTTNLLAIRLFAYTAWTFWPLYIAGVCAWLEFTRPAELLLLSARSSSSPSTAASCTYFSTEFRKRQLCINVVWGVLCYLIFTYCLWAVEPLTVNTTYGRMEYKTCQKYVDEVPEWQNKLGRFVYTYTVVASLFFSSLPYSHVLAGTTGISAAVSYYLWEAQFESTWCYFAALISSFIVFMVHCEVNLLRDDWKGSSLNGSAKNGNNGLYPSKKKA